MTAILVLLNAQMSPKKDYLLQSREETIGRGTSNTLPLSVNDGHEITVTKKDDDKETITNNILTTSRKHAKLLLVNGAWTILDISDENFVTINGGEHISKNTPVPIQGEDIISLGHAQLKFLLSVDEAVQRVTEGSADPTTITKN